MRKRNGRVTKASAFRSSFRTLYIGKGRARRNPPPGGNPRRISHPQPFTQIRGCDRDANAHPGGSAVDGLPTRIHVASQGRRLGFRRRTAVGARGHRDGLGVLADGVEPRPEARPLPAEEPSLSSRQARSAFETSRCSMPPSSSLAAERRLKRSRQSSNGATIRLSWVAGHAQARGEDEREERRDPPIGELLHAAMVVADRRLPASPEPALTWSSRLSL